MRGLSALLLLALLLAPTASAQWERSPPPPGTVWTVYNTVEAVVRDNYATVKVIADIGNRGPDPEFPFVVRVPDDAFVTGLTVERDGRVYEAEIKGREEAREEYEEWKSQEQTGALVEKTRRSDVYAYLVNVAEFTSVRATLTYERYLAAEQGVYNLSLEAPVSGFGEDLGARFDITVTDSDGLVGLWGEQGGTRSGNKLTYEVGPRSGVESPTPFTASYMVGATDDEGSLLTTVRDGKGYFAHRFRAESSDEQLPMDLVLVLDVSGSMAGMKLDQMIDAAKQVVASLDAEDRLHLVAFSSDARASWSGMRAMTPEARKAAAEEIDALFDGGGTNIEAGLRDGFAALDGIDWREAESRFPALVLLTDGQPTAGATSHDALLRIERDANEHEVPVFGIAFGDDADWALIRLLADQAEGAAIRVPLGTGAEVDIRRFMTALTTPVLRDVRIEYSDGVKAYETGAPVLLAGSELLVVGTFDPEQGISGVVTARAPDGPRRYTFDGGSPASLPFLPRLVAYQQVRELSQDDSPDVEAIEEIALDFGFVTDHTSLVLTLPAREFTPGPTPTDDRWMSGDAATSTAPASSPSGGPSWWPFGTRSEASEAPQSVAMRDTDGAPTAPTSTSGAPTPTPRVPGPAPLLVLLAVAALALVLRRR